MKIALCLEYPVGLRGGVSVLVETLLQELTRHGHEMALVSPDAPPTLRESETGRLIRHHFYWEPRHRPSVADARNLARRLSEARVDLAHFHLGGNYGWGNRFPWHCLVFFLDRLGVSCVSTVHLVVSILDGYCGEQKPVWFKALMLAPGLVGENPPAPPRPPGNRCFPTRPPEVASLVLAIAKPLYADLPLAFVSRRRTPPLNRTRTGHPECRPYRLAQGTGRARRSVRPHRPSPSRMDAPTGRPGHRQCRH